jgi:uncharacterized protein
MGNTQPVGGVRTRMSRRRWLWNVAWATPMGMGAHARWIEPDWLSVRTHRLNPNPTLRIAHFTDIHHRGDEARLREVVRTVDTLKPDFAVFTGDLVEEADMFAPALEILATLRCPLYGIAGNHDYWARVDFGLARTALARTGGAWLKDTALDVGNGRVRLLALDRLPAVAKPRDGVFNLVLMHYPVWADRLPYKADLLLAGHSHGGQVRIPFYGALVKPHDVGRYELGWYDTPAGRLYVNPGIGSLKVDFRFNCRPEVTLFEI